MRGRLIGAALASLAGLMLPGCGGGAEAVTEAGAETPPAVAPPVSLPEGARDAPSSADTETREVTCIVGPKRYKGPCQFDPLGRGSFALAMADGAPLYGEVTEILVFVFAPGEAEVRTRTLTGTERLGEAKRMPDYPACWLGASGWSVCAY